MKWDAATGEQIPAWVAEMDFGLAPPIARALHDLVDRAEFGYISPARIEQFRAAVADWYTTQYSLPVGANHVHPLGDVVEAYRRTIEVFSPAGSPIIVPVPSYAPFLFTPETMGRPVIRVPLAHAEDENVLDLDAIDAAFAAGGRLLVLCNPYNPLGRVFSTEELRAVAAIVDKHGGFVFSDEIHAPLVFDGRHVPYASVAPVAAAHSVTGFSPSKAFNLPALKAAVVITNNEDQRRSWAGQGPLVFHGASIPGVVANTAALTEGRAWLAEVTEYLRGNRDLVAEAVAATPAARATPPEATYLYWIDLSRAGHDSPVDTLAARGVLASGGAVFGNQFGQFIRLNFGLPRPILTRVLERFIDAF